MREKVFHQRSITGILSNESKFSSSLSLRYANPVGTAPHLMVVTDLVLSASSLGSASNIPSEHVVYILASWDVASHRLGDEFAMILTKEMTDE